MPVDVVSSGVRRWIRRRTWILPAVALLAAAVAPDVALGQDGVQGGSGGTNLPEHLEKPYVVLVSFDGMRWDYLDRVETPNFDRVARRGARADALIPIFPTQTFPTHYSIATGMYAESHGLVGNRFYDPEWDERYSMSDRTTVEDGRWYGGEPIWVTAERQGMISAAFFWVGTEADVYGIRPTHYRLFDHAIPYEDRVDQVLAWLGKAPERRPHVITLYFEEVDSRGHDHGPDAPEVDEAIRAMDALLGRLLDGIESLPVADRVHLILVSDHGMAWADDSGLIRLDDLADLDGIRSSGQASFMVLWFDGDTARRDAVYADLSRGLAGRGARVYRREEIPERLRYRQTPRAGDLLVLADPGYLVSRRASLWPVGRGVHGYDPAEPVMHGIFLAMGTRIRAGVRIPAFEMVHIYPLLAELLELEPYPGIDGRLDVLEPILR